MIMSLILLLVWSLMFMNLFMLSFWMNSSRYSLLLKNSYSSLSGLFGFQTKASMVFFSSLMMCLVALNITSSIPYSSSPTLYYFFSSSLSYSLWIGLFLLLVVTQFYNFISHMMPYGSPMFLGLLLPVVELFSQIIRPLTLMVRISTNLSAGHIMLFMFSFFSLSSFILTMSSYLVCVILMVLEMCISVLQAYIFISLSYMYYSESL